MKVLERREIGYYQKFNFNPVKMRLIKINIAATKQKGVWVAICLDYDIVMQGESYSSVVKDCEAAVCEYIDSFSGLNFYDLKKFYKHINRPVPIINNLLMRLRCLFFRNGVLLSKNVVVYYKN